ncbi:IS630 family transposase [Gynuella sp.]|uniref:IS630 family transposase n=1 Tax=Gynuella sp. TaxID=2969146 RepID=UPI003D13FC17
MHSLRDRALSDFEAEEAKRWILQGDPRQYGFDFGLWTRQIVADLIKDRMGIEIDVTAVGDMLHRLGLTPYRPMRRAYERNDEGIEIWKRETYPAISKKAKKQGAEIFWLDEATIRSDDSLLRTWGEKGKTPIVETSCKRQGINAISALSNTGGFWYQIFTGKFNAEGLTEALKDLLSNRKKPIFVIMDGHPVYKSKAVRDFLKEQRKRIQVFLLPPYAPDLNPDELVWNNVRSTGTARTPLKNGESLYERTFIDFELIAQNKKLVKLYW